MKAKTLLAIATPAIATAAVIQGSSGSPFSRAEFRPPQIDSGLPGCAESPAHAGRCATDKSPPTTVESAKSLLRAITPPLPGRERRGSDALAPDQRSRRPEPRWTLDRQKCTLLGRIFDNRKDDLVRMIDAEMRGGDPTVLYNVQLYTAPLLSAAARMKDAHFLDGLAEIYLAALPHLTLESEYLFYYWPGE